MPTPAITAKDKDLTRQQAAHARERADQAKHRHRHHRGRRAGRRIRSLLGGFHNLGPDVSTYQGSVNWGLVAKTSSWAFTKAGGADGGSCYKDGWYSAPRIAAMRKAGLVVGTYFFANPTASATTQGKFFAELCKQGGIQHGDWVALDYELPGGDPDTFIAAFWKAFNAAFKPHVTRWLYGGYYLLAGCKKKHGCRLWIAAYPNIVGVPAVFKNDPDILHQFTDHQSFAGISSPCDASSFVRGKRGFKAALK